jgi:RimJ/RimL family protein N-acetyltransferase
MIETERLFLREWCDADREPFSIINAKSDVMQHLGGVVDRIQSDAMIDRQIASQHENGCCFWAIDRKPDAKLIGYCGLRKGGHLGTPVPNEMEIGWRLDSAAWQQGYAREAAEASVAWGWDNTDASRIAAWTVPANKASWGLMIRIGMVHRPELDFDHPQFPPGHPLSRHLVYMIDRPI